MTTPAVPPGIPVSPSAPVRAGIPGAPLDDEPEAPFDPLRLCIFATIALLGWIFGPFALAVFAGLGFSGYWRARRAGLTRSRCYLRDTRLVLGYLALLMILAAAGVWWRLTKGGMHL